MRLCFILLILGTASMAQAQNHPLPDFDSLWNYDQPAQTESKFRTIFPNAQTAGDTAYMVELMTQIARTLGLQQKFDQANQLLDSAEELLPAAGERAWVRYQLERGRVLNSSKHQAEALPMFEAAWDRATNARLDQFAVDAAHMCGIAAPTTDQKMEWNLKALAVAENSSDPKAQHWRGSLYNNMGWDYFDIRQYDSALELFSKDLLFRGTQHQAKEARIAKWSIARTLRAKGKVDSALAMQKQLEQEWLASGEPQDGYVFEEIAECLFTLGRIPEATPYFARAYEYLSKDPWLTRDEPDRLDRLKRLAAVK
jgi:tetratricopeptide (TPR) repeat protein